LLFWRIIVDSFFSPEKLKEKFPGFLMLLSEHSIHRRARGGHVSCRFFFL
jgi:hypothetical protein